MPVKRKPALNDAMIGEATDLFSAMGDKSRLKILRVLLDAGVAQTQGEMLEETGLSQANLSKHLACLVRAGLVTREPKGAMVLYRPVLPLVSNLCDLVCGHVSEQIRQRYRDLR